MRAPRFELGTSTLSGCDPADSCREHSSKFSRISRRKHRSPQSIDIRGRCAIRAFSAADGGDIGMDIGIVPERGRLRLRGTPTTSTRSPGSTTAGAPAAPACRRAGRCPSGARRWTPAGGAGSTADTLYEHAEHAPECPNTLQGTAGDGNDRTGTRLPPFRVTGRPGLRPGNRPAETATRSTGRDRFRDTNAPA